MKDVYRWSISYTLAFSPERLSDMFEAWMNEWMNEWMNNWTNNQMNEYIINWMNACVYYQVQIHIQNVQIQKHEIEQNIGNGPAKNGPFEVWSIIES